MRRGGGADRGWVSPMLNRSGWADGRLASIAIRACSASRRRNEWTYAGCSPIGTGLLLMQDDEPHCLRCVQLDHLVFRPADNAQRTRRAHRASTLTAVMARFSRTRKRYERQGLLVEPHAGGRTTAT